jgi:urease accessory protein
MKRVTTIKPAGTWSDTNAADRVLLAADERQRRRSVLTAENGSIFLLDLARPVTLRDGDGLVLDDGSIVRVAGTPEDLIEILTRVKSDAIRLAWHLGNRHTDLQVIGHKLRIRRDHVLEDMLHGLGADLTRIEAPFEPEVAPPGAAVHDH